MPADHPQFSSLQHLWRRGTSFLGCRHAILGGAMTWVSDHRLVSALSEAGGFGVLAGGALLPSALREEIQKTASLTASPFGVNLILFHPQIQELLEVCKDERVSHVFLGAGFPSKEQVQYIKAYGGHPVGFAPSASLGQRLINIGIEALVIEGTEAGGHVGPVATSVLAQEILPALGHQVPVFVAGGIGDGQAILSYLLRGAAGCQLGTRFVCATESCAHPRFKEAFVKASSRDAVLSVQLDPLFPVIPVRSLANQGMKNFVALQKEVIDAFHAGTLSQKEAQMKIEFFWSGALRRAVVEGDVTEGSLMAGQSVGLIEAIEPCATIVNTLVQQALDGLAHLSHVLQETA